MSAEVKMDLYERTLKTFAENSRETMILTAENRAAIRNLPALLGPRFVDFGIAEQTMIGAAAGLALRGRRPIVHALAAFLTMRAFEFIRTDVGIPGLPVTLVGGVPGFLSEANGPTHQAIEDIALMRLVPNMCVFCPSDQEELAAGLPILQEAEVPLYVRFNALPAPAKHRPFTIGRAEVFGQGTDAAILTYGFLLREALEAQVALARRGIDVRVVNMRTLVPIDEDTILETADAVPLLVTLEDHFAIGGLYSSLAETLFENKRCERVLRFALDRRWFRPALLPDVLEVERFTALHVAEQIEKELSLDA